MSMPPSEFGGSFSFIQVDHSHKKFTLLILTQVVQFIPTAFFVDNRIAVSIEHPCVSSIVFLLQQGSIYDSCFVFHNSSQSFQKLIFSRTHILHKSLRVNRK